MMEQPKGGNRSRKYSGKRRGKKRKEEEKKRTSNSDNAEDQR